MIKAIHITCVVLSYTLFFLRGIWMLRDSPSLQKRWARTVPDTVDSVLFLSAVTLAWQLGFSPLHETWLATKIAALPLYIALGMVALRFGKTKRIRLAAWLMAQAVFVYIVSVAMTHDPAPWRGLRHAASGHTSITATQIDITHLTGSNSDNQG